MVWYGMQRRNRGSFKVNVFRDGTGDRENVYAVSFLLRTRAEMENAEEAAQELDIAGTAAWIVAAGLRKVALQLTVIFVPAWCMSTRAEPAKPSCPNRARSRGSAG